jgi:hypothetical protein
MKEKRIRDLFKTGATKTGAVLLATALVFGSSMWAGNQTESIPELPKFIDPIGVEELVDIEPDQTPEGNTKVTTKTKTTKSTKKVKLKKKATKTYSKKSAAKKTTKTTKKTTSAATTTTKVDTTTQMTSNFKKGSNINTQVTTKKVVTTTTVVTAAKTTAQVSAANAATATAGKTTVALSNAAPKLDSNVASAFTACNFTIIVDPSVSYGGLFQAEPHNRTITLRTLDDTVYHELGHFLAYIAGSIDLSAEFRSIFEQEQSKYTEFNKAYVCQNSKEYFAESYKNYILDKDALKVSRPLTYATIEKALSMVTADQINRYKDIFDAMAPL